MAANKPTRFLMCPDCGWEVPNYSKHKEVKMFCKMCKAVKNFEEDSDNDYHRAPKKRKH